MHFRSLPRLARHRCARPLLCALIATSLGACSDDDYGTTRPTQDASAAVSPMDLSAAADMTIASDARPADFVVASSDAGDGGG